MAFLLVSGLESCMIANLEALQLILLFPSIDGLSKAPRLPFVIASKASLSVFRRYQCDVTRAI